MPMYSQNDPNYPTAQLSYNLSESNTTIASVPYPYSNGYFGIWGISDDFSTQFYAQFSNSGTTTTRYTYIPYSSSVAAPTASISNNTLTISTHIQTAEEESSVSLKSSGSNYGEGVIVAKNNNKLIFTIPNEEQLIISPISSFVDGTYLNVFDITDNNSVNWKFSSGKVDKYYDILTISDFSEIIYSNGTSGASNVDTSYFMNNFANFTSDSNGVNLNNFKRGPNPSKTFNSVVYTIQSS